MKLSELFNPNPPPMLPMQREARAGSQGHYDGQGRYCAPQTEISFSALESNVSMLQAHQQAQWNSEIELRNAIDGKFEELERRIKDSETFMYYARQFHPAVVAEWETAQKAKRRLGLENNGQVFDEAAIADLLKTP